MPFARTSPLEEAHAFAERDYRVAATDPQGRSERIWVRVPPYLARLVQTILHTRAYPWQTPSDVYRFAIYWGLRLLRDKPQQVLGTFSQVQAMNEILMREADQIAFRAIFDRTSDIIADYQREGIEGLGEARRVIAELDARINQMEAGFWQDKYRKTLRERFGAIMQGERMPVLNREMKERIEMGQRATIFNPEEPIDPDLVDEDQAGEVIE